MTRQADRNAERQDPKGLGPEGMRAAVCEADAPTTSPMDKTVEVSQAARELLACPFCQQPLHIRGRIALYGRCETLECWMRNRTIGIPIGNEREVARWNTRATQPEAALREALERIDSFVRKYFEPWGSWKTTWWEGEVSDEAAFSDHNALMHVANLARAILATLSPAEPPPESREEALELLATATGDRDAWLKWYSQSQQASASVLVETALSAIRALKGDGL